MIVVPFGVVINVELRKLRRWYENARHHIDIIHDSRNGVDGKALEEPISSRCS